MTARDNLATVADGDQLNQGYFNEIWDFYVQATDTSASNLTTSSSSPAALRTFAFTSAGSTYAIKAVELEDITVTSGSGSVGQVANLHVELDNGTDFWSWSYPTDDRVSGGEKNRNVAYIMKNTGTHGAGMPAIIQVQRNGGTVTLDAISLPGTIDMTGATTWTLKLYGSTDTGTNMTLNKAFTARLVVSKRPQDLGTTVNQS